MHTIKLKRKEKPERNLIKSNLSASTSQLNWNHRKGNDEKCWKVKNKSWLFVLFHFVSSFFFWFQKEFNRAVFKLRWRSLKHCMPHTSNYSERINSIQIEWKKKIFFWKKKTTTKQPLKLALFVFISRSVWRYTIEMLKCQALIDVHTLTL